MEDSKTKVVSSWGVHKKLQKVYDKVRKKVPAVGEVEDKKKNPKLERLRKAENYAYDLFNNGLANYRSQFLRFYKIPSHQVPAYGSYWHSYIWDELEQQVEPVLSKVLIDAYVEQYSTDELINDIIDGNNSAKQSEVEQEVEQLAQ